jgi:hypothetical protein
MTHGTEPPREPRLSWRSLDSITHFVHCVATAGEWHAAAFENWVGDGPITHPFIWRVQGPNGFQKFGGAETLVEAELAAEAVIPTDVLPPLRGL